MTSKANSPPSYEEALHHPKSEDCSYLPPPSYSPSPGMYPGPPGYWSQGGVFPQAGVSPGFSPSIPTLSAALPASHSGQGFGPRSFLVLLCTQITSLFTQVTWRSFSGTSGRARLSGTPSSERCGLPASG